MSAPAGVIALRRRGGTCARALDLQADKRHSTGHHPERS